MARTHSALHEATAVPPRPHADGGDGDGDDIWHRVSGEDPTAVLDPSGCIVDVNTAWTATVEIGPDLHAPVSGPALLPSCATSTPAGSTVAERVTAALAQVLGGSRRRVELEYSCTCSLDERRFLLQIVGANETSPSHVLVRHVDLSARHARDEHLADLPTVHAATGLPSRTSIGHQLAAALELTPAEAHPVLIEVHLRALADIAEQHGRLVADEVAVLAAARLRRTVRVDDVVGADDDGTLVVLCPTADDAQLDAVVRRVGRTMSRPILVGARTLDPRVEVRVDRATRSAQDDPPTATRMDTPAATPAGSQVPAVSNLASAADGRRTLQRVLEHASDVVMLFAGDGTITWVSPAAQRVFRIAPEQLLGRNGMDLVHPDDRDRAADAFMSIPALGDQVRAEFRILAGDGSIMWVEEVVTNLLEDRDVGAVYANLRDVSERKRAESSIEFQARLLDSVGQALVAIDDDRRVRYWNDAAARMYGFTPEHALGRNIDEVVRPADGWQDRYAELVRHVDHGASWSGELRLRHSDGHSVPAIVTMTPVFDARRRQIASIAVASDISDQLRSNELAARLSTVVESSQDAIISTTLDGTITTWNRAATELFALTAEDMIGGNSRELAPVELHDQIDLLTELLSAGHALHDAEMELVRADGTPLQLSLSVAPILDDAGTPIGASISARDLGERIRLQQKMVEDHARLVEAQQITHLGSYEYDPAAGEVTRSEECDRIYGIEPGAGDVNLLDFVHPDDVEETLHATELALEGGGSVERTIRIVRPDGATRWVRCRSALVERGGRTLLAGTILDVTEQHLAELALAQQATHDSLTGLPNRIGLHAHLTRLLASNSTQRIAVAILDLDRFKIINDTLGHRVGDETLRAVADRLRDELGPDDVIARLGGDEFVLVRGDLPDELDHARRLATDALAALEDPIVVGGRRFDLSGSIGVTLSAPVDSAESLLSDADVAMYLAKQRGGRNVSVFDEAARERANRHTEVESALRGAVGRGEMSMHYQPIVDVADGRVRGFEALARWQHPRLGAVGPDEFVPIAEASGAIVPLGRWGVHTVLEQIATWSGVEPTDDLWVAINLSSAQLGEGGFVDWFDRELRASGVPAHRVHLEITERVLIEHIEQAVDTIAALRALGAQISIDDFGTGYSSLSYLDQLPVDVLKVDRSFVDRLGPSARDTAVVRSIVALARTLELSVVVEGVETSEQRSIVAELACELGQGYLWSRPLPPAAALEYLRAHR